MNSRGEVLKHALFAGADAIKMHAPNEGIIDKEGRANFVTAADLASEKAIVSLIHTYFPNDSILSEEITSAFTNDELLALDHLWVIDPLDGTNNFRYQRGYSCISIGYVEKGIATLGGVYNFYNDELFFAEKGKGATLNGKPIHVSAQTNLSDGTMATDCYYTSEETKRNIAMLLKIDPIPLVLIKGASALTICDVAAGRVDVYFHTVLKPWDITAGCFIVQEAGGVVKGLGGEKINFLSPEFVLGNQTVVEQFVKFVKNS